MPAVGQYKVFKNENETGRDDGDVPMIGDDQDVPLVGGKQQVTAMSANIDQRIKTLTRRELWCSWLALRFFLSILISGTFAVFYFVEGYPSLGYLFVGIIAVKLCISVTCGLVAQNAKRKLEKLTIGANDVIPSNPSIV